MIHRNDLRKISKARLKDAEALFAARRHDGAVYLCGYAIELALKAKICNTLKWIGYPDSKSEFHNFLSFKVHNLEVLLHLSGAEQKIKNNFLAEWSAVAEWDPSTRYKLIGNAKKEDAELMITSAKIILKSI